MLNELKDDKADYQGKYYAFRHRPLSVDDHVTNTIRIFHEGRKG